MMVPVETRRKETYLEINSARLLPRIPNEITMAEITPKLSWRDFFSLSSVNRGWCHAIRSRQVYDERVRSNSTEALVLLNFIKREYSSSIVLYSTRRTSYYTLCIPHLDGGIPQSCQCVLIDGNMYVLGGWMHANSEQDSRGAGHAVSIFAKEGYGEGRCGSNAVHVLDVAGQGQWKSCARMQNGRAQFGCGVVDGKIYVFGGVDRGDPVIKSEVYDPKKDTWSPIRPMKLLRFDHRVTTVGEELVVHGGKVFSSGYFCSRELLSFRPHISDANYLEFYHPVKDEWRVVNQRTHQGAVFMAQGQFHVLLPKAIHVYDVAKNAWRKKYSCSFAVRPDWSRVVKPCCVTVVDGELLAIVGFPVSPPLYLLHGKGLGCENNKIVWQSVPGWPLMAGWLLMDGWPGDSNSYFMCPIQL